MNRKLLIISFSFYPYSTVSAFRMTRFVKYLPEHGVEPYVITADQGGVDLHKNIPTHTYYKKSLFSYRFDSPVNPAKFKKESNIPLYLANYSVRLIKDILFSPDKHVLWSISIVPKAVEIIKKNRIREVLVTGDPFSLFITGLLLKKLTGVNLILDYRDPWISNTSNLAQTFYRRRYIKSLQKICLKRSDFIFTVNQEIYDELEIDESKKMVLPNGFDPALFEAVKHEKEQSGYSGRPFTFLYAGKSDITSIRYNPVMMFKCFQRFRSSGQQQNNSILKVCGQVTKETINRIRAEKLDENVEFIGMVTNQQVIDIGMQADAFLHFVYPMKREVSLPMKVYEYVMMKRPIISINSSQGLVAELLNRTNAGFACNNDDPDQIVAAMQKAFELDLHQFADKVDDSPLQSHNVKALTGQLATAIFPDRQV